jgi:hypothetical protein
MSAQKGAPTPPRTCPKASPSAARPCAGGGAFDSVGWGYRGTLLMELYLLHPAFCLCYQKPPPPVLLRPSRTLSKASARAICQWKCWLVNEQAGTARLLAKAPSVFGFGRGAETALGSFPHFNRAGSNRVGSLRPRIALFALAEIGKMPA